MANTHLPSSYAHHELSDASNISLLTLRSESVQFGIHFVSKHDLNKINKHISVYNKNITYHLFYTTVHTTIYSKLRCITVSI